MHAAIIDRHCRPGTSALIVMSSAWVRRLSGLLVAALGRIAVSLPDEYRSSFLNRNPINRDLLAQCRS